MFEKYKYREFGECPYVYCNNKPMLPVGNFPTTFF
jgi:hypothetical protein